MKRLAPGDGVPPVTAGRSITAAACTSSHAIVNGSHQPPRNHAAFTFTAGSGVATEKAPASHGFFSGPNSYSTKPRDVLRTPFRSPAAAMKLRALNEKVAS